MRNVAKYIKLKRTITYNNKNISLHKVNKLKLHIANSKVSTTTIKTQFYYNNNGKTKNTYGKETI